MRTAVGNSVTDYVTTVYPTTDLELTPRQRLNALRRMHAPDDAALRFVPVAGARVPVEQFGSRLEAPGQLWPHRRRLDR